MNESLPLCCSLQCHHPITIIIIIISTLSLQAEILSGCTCSDNSFLQEYLSVWSSSFGTVPDTLPGKQPFWDRPGIQVDRQMVENSLSSPIQRAAFLAATSQHSGDWLFALPIASCGLRLDDEAVRIAIGDFGVRLGLQLCIPHRCRCGAQVDAHGRHSFICKRAPVRTIRHHHLNGVNSQQKGTARFV